MTEKHAEEATGWLYYASNQYVPEEMKAMHSAMLAQAEATLAVAEQARIRNRIELERLRGERVSERGNYFGPDLIWGHAPSEHASAPLFEDIKEGLSHD